MRRTLTVLLTAIAVSPLLAGCASDATDDPAGIPTASETSSPPTPDEPTPEAPTSEPTSDATAPAEHPSLQTGEGTGAGLVLVDVRVVRSDRSDRIVMEFSGTGTPGWTVDRTDRPQLEGSGEDVELRGEDALLVFASGTTWPAPDYYSGPARLDVEPGGAVEDVYVGGTFEGYTQLLAGVSDPDVLVRVRTLTAPSRLVIDVTDPDGQG